MSPVRSEASAHPHPTGRRPPWSAALHLCQGLLAAALGLSVLAMTVLLLWTISPHPDSGPGGAVRTAADLWLLAHGVHLLRTETLSGVPAPIGLTPLLLVLLPGWLLVRAVRVSLTHGREPGVHTADPREGPGAALGISLGYLLAAAVVVHTADAPLRPEPLSAALQLPLFTLAATAIGVWRVCGPPAMDRFRRLRESALWLQETGALRAAAAGTAALCGAGALLAAGALALHADAAQLTLGRLTGDWSGRISVLLLAGALVPNAAVWAASYGLGPGFILGAGTPIAPPALGGEPPLSALPLLAPAAGGGPQAPELWAVAAMAPLAGVLAAAWCVAHTAVPVRADRVTATGWAATAQAALLTAGGMGIAMALLTVPAGGPLGTGELAEFGPSAWRTGLATAVWAAVLGTPAALLLRLWRLRGVPPAAGAQDRRASRPRPGRRTAAPDDLWHTTGARRVRWAALRQSSGRLVPTLPPHGGRDDRPAPAAEARGSAPAGTGAGEADPHDDWQSGLLHQDWPTGSAPADAGAGDPEPGCPEPGSPDSVGPDSVGPESGSPDSGDPDSGDPDSGDPGRPPVSRSGGQPFRRSSSP
ncbi:DUF6350 family protein [Streptomyces sp. ACA25]|uniref:cell division protein PerM n=1 Tax=Streptomyces sp. ACA25 TaxID=3022596 RepID=UPI002306FC92|nr:DUF6350 family protein [Streptomyces sp. ACA25]MDB1087373.1 DUF6350 family protein [Streptomyces sp. ACA25]